MTGWQLHCNMAGNRAAHKSTSNRVGHARKQWKMVRCVQRGRRYVCIVVSVVCATVLFSCTRIENNGEWKWYGSDPANTKYVAPRSNQQEQRRTASTSLALGIYRSASTACGFHDLDLETKPHL